jgi:predicted CoA-binding protein
LDICKILEESKTIAVVGISSNPNRTSRMIADFLIRKGYNVVGVNPGKPKIEGIEVFANLKDIPFEIDIIDVFRKPEDIPQIIPDVLAVNPKVLWLQLGIRNDDAVEPVVEKGIKTVQDRCIKIEHGMCF